MNRLIFKLSLIFFIYLLWAQDETVGVKDNPFTQLVSHKWTFTPELRNAKALKFKLDISHNLWILTDHGLARIEGHSIRPDRRYAFLRGKSIVDIEEIDGQIFILLDNEIISPVAGGIFTAQLPWPGFYKMAVASDRTVLLLGPKQVIWFKGSEWVPVKIAAPWLIKEVYSRGNEFFLLTSNSVIRVQGGYAEEFYSAPNIRTIGFGTNRIWIASNYGLRAVNYSTKKEMIPFEVLLPNSNIFAIVEAPSGLWVGLEDGLWHRSPDGLIRWYRGSRWFPSQKVLQIIPTSTGTWTLTTDGVAWLEARLINLAEKIAIFDEDIYRAHMRFSLCVPLRLISPGDISGAELMITAADALRTSVYVISQALRFSITADPNAARRAWESFTALERLEWLYPAPGIPGASFARAGDPIENPLEWEVAREAGWKIMHPIGWRELPAFIAAAWAMDKYVAKNIAERQRISVLVNNLAERLLNEQERWIVKDLTIKMLGRWDPAYVNSLKEGNIDRKVITTQILATYQLAYRLTERMAYRKRIEELLQQHEYLFNLTNNPSGSASTSYQQDYIIGFDWHLPAFLSYLVLYETALSLPSRQIYRDTIYTHWLTIQNSRDPLWLTLLYKIGVRDQNLNLLMVRELQEEPIDRVNWPISAFDAYKIFYQRTLPPRIERPLMDVSDNPNLTIGGDGLIVIPPVQSVLAFWLARESGMIRSPTALTNPAKFSSTPGD